MEVYQGMTIRERLTFGTLGATGIAPTGKRNRCQNCDGYMQIWTSDNDSQVATGTLAHHASGLVTQSMSQRNISQLIHLDERSE